MANLYWPDPLISDKAWERVKHKFCAPFYIGEVNIYDYQRSGFYRWNTFKAAQTAASRWSRGEHVK